MSGGGSGVKSSTKISLDATREAQRAVLAASRYPGGSKDAQSSAMFVGTQQLRSEVEGEGDTASRKSWKSNTSSGTVAGRTGKFESGAQSSATDRGKFGSAGSKIVTQPAGPGCNTDTVKQPMDAPESPDSAGPLSPGRTKGLAGFWANQNDDVKVKKKRFVAEESGAPDGGVVVENTPQRLEGVVRAEDPGEWAKPLDLEPGKTRNIASTFQQKQAIPPPTAKKPFRQVQEESGTAEQKIRVKDIGEKLVRQTSQPVDQQKDARASVAGDVIVLAENQPEEVGSDVVKSELQAKDEPVFEAGRTKNLLKHWINTEVEYNAPKTSTSRLEKGAKPAWIAEIEEAKGIKVDNVGFETSENAEQTSVQYSSAEMEQNPSRASHGGDPAKENKTHEQLYQEHQKALQQQHQQHKQQQWSGDSKVRQVGVVEPSMKSGGYDECVDVYSHLSSSAAQSRASPAPSPVPRTSTFTSSSYAAAEQPVAAVGSSTLSTTAAGTTSGAVDDLWRSVTPDRSSSPPYSSSSSSSAAAAAVQKSEPTTTSTTMTTTSKDDLEAAEDMIRGILDDLDRQTAELDHHVFGTLSETSASNSLSRPANTMSSTLSYSPPPSTNVPHAHPDISELRLQDEGRPFQDSGPDRLSSDLHVDAQRDVIPQVTSRHSDVTRISRSSNEEQGSRPVSRSDDTRENINRLSEAHPDRQGETETSKSTDKHKHADGGKGKKSGKGGDKSGCSVM